MDSPAPACVQERPSCRLTLVRADRRVDWNIPDPKDMPDDEFREVRDLIERKVKELLASLAPDSPV